MARHNDTGQSGEQEAGHYLTSKGFTIIHTNWRYKKEEVDLIVENEEYLVFVEVKTRTTEDFGSPEEFVSRKKQLHLIKAANAYIEENDIDKEARFDIIAVILQPQFKIIHLEEAFYP